MKILQIINNLGSGGAEKLIADFAPIMKQKGHDLEVLLLKREGSLYIKQLEEYEIPITYLSENRLYDLRYIWRIRQFIRKGRFDVVHVHIFLSLYFTGLAAFLGIGNVKLFFTEHSTTNKRMQNILFRIIDRLIYKAYDTIICITEEVNKAIRHHLQPIKCRFVTVQNGINLQSFNTPVVLQREQLYQGCCEHHQIVTMVARFSEHKDHSTLIKAIALLTSNVHLLLIGEGPLREDYENLSAILGIQNRVHFLGLRMDVPDILRLSDVGVLSSNWEGFGLAAVEKMAAGLPVLASNVKGLSSIVVGAGILFEKGNEVELAEILKSLFSNSIQRQKLAILCKERSLNYSIESMVDSYLFQYTQ